MNLLLFLLMPILSDSTVLTVSSAGFRNNEPIPMIYSCTGSNVNPPLTVEQIPPSAKSLAIIVDDPDAPNGTFVHWVVWNIPVTGRIEENSDPGVQGKNGKNENGYTGPCPPDGTHHYYFKVYALDRMLDLPDKTDKAALLNAMEGHIVAAGDLIGVFTKNSEY